MNSYKVNPHMFIDLCLNLIFMYRENFLEMEFGKLLGFSIGIPARYERNDLGGNPPADCQHLDLKCVKTLVKQSQ